MSLYKTQRCRHFDETGNPIKPYCSQGNKCRFIHPNDHQWEKLKRRDDDASSPENREGGRSKGKNRRQLSPNSPPSRQRSSPLTSQTDLFNRKQKGVPREYDHRDWSVRNGDRRRDSDPWVCARERNGSFEQGYSLKRANDEGDPYPNQRPRLSERSSYTSSPTSGCRDTRRAAETDKAAYSVRYVPESNLKTAMNVSDTFHRLAKSCCEIFQDTCFLDRDEDKLKAFTDLSSELSKATPDAAMAVTPALATVINGHSRTRGRLESHVEELEVLWKSLFSMLEGEISKVIDSRLGQAMAVLDKEKDNVLETIVQSQRPIGDGVHDGATGPRQWTHGRKDIATDRASTLSERGAVSINGGPAVKAAPEEARRHGGSASLSLVPTQEGDLGTSLRIVLEDMKMQMDRQTRAIELLAQENFQLRSAAERIPPQLVPSNSTSSSPRKASIM